MARHGEAGNHTDIVTAVNFPPITGDLTFHTDALSTFNGTILVIEKHAASSLYKCCYDCHDWRLSVLDCLAKRL